ncbi:MAG: DinB family protein [Bacteroidales bacterium]|jgi:hypothetical protein
MKEVTYIIDCLERTPVILNNLLNQIPENLYKTRRIDNKWSIHEQVCHLTEAQKILIERFRIFKTEENPFIISYNPPNSRSSSYYLELDMKTELNKFPVLRADMILMLKGFDESYWEREGKHEVFAPYNTGILLTHALNVDYAHLFSIEQLGLTKAGFENEILTIP